MRKLDFRAFEQCRSPGTHGYKCRFCGDTANALNSVTDTIRNKKLGDVLCWRITPRTDASSATASKARAESATPISSFSHNFSSVSNWADPANEPYLTDPLPFSTALLGGKVCNYLHELLGSTQSGGKTRQQGLPFSLRLFS